MQKMIEGKGIAPHFQMEFGSLVEQFLLHINQGIEECVKHAVKAAVEETNRALTPSLNLGIEGFLSRAETLKFLKLSPPTLYRYQNTGLLPYHKVGRKIYFKKTDLVEATKVELKKKGAKS